VLPQDLEGVALGVVLEAGEAQEGGVAGVRGEDDLVHEVLAGAHVHDLAGLERAGVAPGGGGGGRAGGGRAGGFGRFGGLGLGLGVGGLAEQAGDQDGLLAAGFGEAVDAADVLELVALELFEEPGEGGLLGAREQLDVRVLGLGGRELELEDLDELAQPGLGEDLQDGALVGLGHARKGVHGITMGRRGGPQTPGAPWRGSGFALRASWPSTPLKPLNVDWTRQQTLAVLHVVPMAPPQCSISMIGLPEGRFLRGTPARQAASLAG
jgi:hypothetical protein